MIYEVQQRAFDGQWQHSFWRGGPLFFRTREAALQEVYKWQEATWNGQHSIMQYRIVAHEHLPPHAKLVPPAPPVVH